MGCAGCGGSVQSEDGASIGRACCSICPWSAAGDVSRCSTRLARWGLRRWGTAARGGCDYIEVDLAAADRPGRRQRSPRPGRLAGAHLDGTLRIPMAGPAESLNVATAASVFCFEAARQRRSLSGGGGDGRGKRPGDDAFPFTLFTYPVPLPAPRQTAATQQTGTAVTAHPLPDVPDTESLRATLEAIEADALARLEAATDGSSLREASRQVLGKRSELARLHTRLRDLPAEQRKEVGAWIHSARPASRNGATRSPAGSSSGNDMIRLDTERLDLTEFTSGPAAAPLAAHGTGPRPPQPGHPDPRTSLRTPSSPWASRSLKAPRRRRTGTTSKPSTCRRPTRPGACGTRSTCGSARPRRCCCEPTPHPVQIRLMESQPPPIYAVMPGTVLPPGHPRRPSSAGVSPD